jgi:hypothetical protein
MVRAVDNDDAELHEPLDQSHPGWDEFEQTVGALAVDDLTTRSQLAIASRHTD